jgi:deoxyribodipyrimidine photo-lyase
MILPEATAPIHLFWFRRDLRLRDNAGLYEALKSGCPVLPVFIFDTDILNQLPSKKDGRVAFIHHRLRLLQGELLALGSSLLVLHGKPLEVLEQLTARLPIAAVFANADYEPGTIERDRRVSEMLRLHGISLNLFKDHVVFEKSEVVKADGSTYTVFTPYSKAWKSLLSVRGLPSLPSETLLHRLLQTAPLSLPGLEDIGFENSLLPGSEICPIPGSENSPFLGSENSPIPGSENNLLLVPEPVIDETILLHYDETRNFPALRGTSNLSVHLRFGTMSIREATSKALALNEAFLNELIWRDFFIQILYHFPSVVSCCFKPAYNVIPWRNDEAEFQRWCQGETGYPIVDAGMRELNETGFMHNRVRMVVASYLTKHLLIDWRWGEAYFAAKLMDYELASNNGNWQWAAGCGCDAAPYFRVFNPYEQQAKFDPSFTYIDKWVKNRLRSDYPAPMVEHKFARERFLGVFKSALANT